MQVQRQEKPWGHELLLAHTERYAGKLLCIRRGQRLSLQHHAKKDETLFLLDGEVDLEMEAGAFGMLCLPVLAGRSYWILPGERHRILAVSDATVLEVSTPKLEAIVRWADDYGGCVTGDGGPGGDAAPMPGRCMAGRGGTSFPERRSLRALQSTGAGRLAAAPGPWAGGTDSGDAPRSERTQGGPWP